MILYTCITNQGGMKRVGELMLSIQGFDDLHVMIFGAEEPRLREGQHWMPWEEADALSPAALEKQVARVHEFCSRYGKPTFVIGDDFTLPAFERLGCPLVYDVHMLGRPLYAAIDGDPAQIRLDRMVKVPVYLMVQAGKFDFLRHETRLMKLARAFLVNSQDSLRRLRDDYADVSTGKGIHLVNVAGELPPPRHRPSRKMPFYVFGRWHPQKGLKNLLQHDWAPDGLWVRGLSPTLLSSEGQQLLQQRSIHLLPWTSSDEALSDDLAAADVVLFPALYEPWGLALQEALRAGALCVAHPNSSGHDEQIRSGDNGFLLDMRSPALLDELRAIRARDDAPVIRQRAASGVSSSGQLRETQLKSALAEILRTL